MKELQIKVLLWLIGVLFSILAFIGALAVNNIIKLNQSVNGLRIEFAAIHEKLHSHDEKFAELTKKPN